MFSGEGGNDLLRLENIPHDEGCCGYLATACLWVLSYDVRQVPCQPTSPRAEIQLPHFILPDRAAGSVWTAHLVTTRDRLIRESAADKTNPAKETCQQN